MTTGSSQFGVTPSSTKAPTTAQTGTRRSVKGKVLLPLVFIAALILIACGGGDADGDQKLPSVSSGSEVEMEQDLAPNFSITMFQGADKVGGGQIDLASLAGQPVILNFWAGLCPPCRAEMPDLQEFYNEYNDRVTLIGIDLGQFTGLGSQKDATDLLEDLNITYPAGFTSEASVIRDYRVLGMPSTVWIDANGQLFKQWTGALNREVLIDQTEAMLAQ